MTVLFINKNEKLNSNTKPPVTRVLLWTKALTGVGALIAFGNHDPRGYWALLLKDVKIMNIIGINFIQYSGIRMNKLKLFILNIINNMKSPKRLVSTVFIAPLQLSQLL